MFAPMTPTTERTRAHNERNMFVNQAASNALPKQNAFSALRKVLAFKRTNTHRAPVVKPQMAEHA